MSTRSLTTMAQGSRELHRSSGTGYLLRLQSSSFQDFKLRPRMDDNMRMLGNCCPHVAPCGVLENAVHMSPIFVSLGLAR